jgi:beta-glucosidase
MRLYLRVGAWSAFAALAVGSLSWVGCSHPDLDPTGGNASTGNGGNVVGVGAGGNGAGNAGNASANGGGGTSSAGGSGSSAGGGGGGNSSGAGGGEVVIVVDAGVDATMTTVAKMACGDSTYSDKYTPGYSAPASPMVQTLVAGMTTAEKAQQMRGTPFGSATARNYNDIQRTLDDTRNGVRGFLFRDGPRGVNLEAPQPGRPAGVNYATAFPVSVARGATFDLDLEYRLGAAMGDETAASGNSMILVPCMNILRHPGWGRAQETYGEDSFHLGRTASALTAGVQTYVAACAKHYAANNIEINRANLNAQMDEQTLREIYARHFEMVVKDGGVACVMAAYNSVNGTKSTQNTHLLTDILRTDFKFRGFVLSDWWAMPPGQTVDSATATYQDNAAAALTAGLDMEVPWSLNFAQLETITPSRVPVTAMNQAVSRILEQKFRFNVASLSGQIGLQRPTTTLAADGSITGNDAHIQLSHQAAVESMVLLKNDTNTLPIKRGGAIHSIAVVGANVNYTITSDAQTMQTVHFATDPRIGDRGSSRVLPDPAKSTGPFAGISKVAGAGITVTSGSDVTAAQNADFVVVVAGMTPQDEGEEYTGAGDRSNFSLDGKVNNGTNSAQNALIAQVAALHKPMVVVLEGGSVIDMPWLAQVPAVVMAWYPGMDGGAALGELLFGDANFSGKLPITWPKSWNDLPTFNAGTTTTMDYYLGYRYFDKNNIAPLYPYGYGLSYSGKFAYSNLQVPCSTVTKNGVVNVQVDITNPSNVAGDEIAFLFVSYPQTTARRSLKELKGFYRVSLDPMQTKRITIPLRVSDLKYWDMTLNQWVVESGPVQIKVGPSSAELPLMDTVTVM